MVTIGRLPDNLIQVDNLAVSGHHAKVSWDTDHYTLEDNNSLNGTFVNNRRISNAVLKDGDEVLIGIILFRDQHEQVAKPGAEKPVTMVPTLEATVVLDTRKSKEMMTHQTFALCGSARWRRPCARQGAHRNPDGDVRQGRPGPIRAHRKADRDRQERHGVDPVEGLVQAQGRRDGEPSRNYVLHRRLGKEGQGEGQRRGDLRPARTQPTAMSSKSPA